MKRIAVIPSRYGSTRFEGKPLAQLAGKPMIQQVYERALQCPLMTDVVVATDDDRIYRAVHQFGGKAVMTSPDCRTGTDRSAEAAEKLGLLDDDIVVNIQGDQPLLHPKCVEEVISPFLSNPLPDMSTLAFKIVDSTEYTNPKDVKVVFDSSGRAIYFSRAPIPWARDTSAVFDQWKHLGVYAYQRRFLEIFRRLPTGRLEDIEKLEQLRAIEFGYKIQVVLTLFDSPEVDMPEDIMKIEAKMHSSQ